MMLVTFVVFDLLCSYGVDLMVCLYVEWWVMLECWMVECFDWMLSLVFDDGSVIEVVVW